MTVYFEDFKEIVARLEDDSKESENYLDSLRLVDSSVSEFVSENQYYNTLYFQNEFLLRKILGDDLFDWVIWYLYEMPMMRDMGFGDDTKTNCTVNGVKYLVTGFDSFMDFAQHALCLPMRPNLSAHEQEEE